MSEGPGLAGKAWHGVEWRGQVGQRTAGNGTPVIAPGFAVSGGFMGSLFAWMSVLGIVIEIIGVGVIAVELYFTRRSSKHLEHLRDLKDRESDGLRLAHSRLAAANNHRAITLINDTVGLLGAERVGHTDAKHLAAQLEQRMVQAVADAKEQVAADAANRPVAREIARASAEIVASTQRIDASMRRLVAVGLSMTVFGLVLQLIGQLGS